MSLMEAVKFSNIAATPAAFSLLGGRYLFAAVATWGGGSVKLQALGPDNSTFVDIFDAYDASAAEQNEPANTLTANGALVLDLPPGTYQFAITTATAVYVSIARAPIGG